MTSSKAASCVYPHLAKAEQAEEQKKVDVVGKPSWATTNAPMWGEPRQVTNRYDRVLGLKRKVNR